jgi:hypothetical protein
VDLGGTGSSQSGSSQGASGSSPGGSSGGQPGAAGSPAAYDGHGFVVHEWGTNTVVVGTDGSMQAGMHHEEEDLPAFVFDRMKEGKLTGGFIDKMETPVIYFYSDVPRTVSTHVEFPEGIFSQWYPAVDSFLPFLANRYSTATSTTTLYDPVLDPAFDASKCPTGVTKLAGGRLDWPNIEILDSKTNVDPMLESAPLSQYTWSHARAVAANPIRVASTGPLGTQLEKFLFYRGLGNASMPAKVTSGGAVDARDASITIQNDGNAPLASAFVIRVEGTQGGYQMLGDVSAHGTVNATAPDMLGAMQVDDFANALARDMTAALDRAGLFHDESVSMVNTWKRQWFRTPGIRVLYLAPQSWTDGLIPLTFEPAPDKVTRIMMIRTEVLTPAIEAQDAPHAQGWNGDAAAQKDAASYFLSLGRFGEPRMRRALAKMGGSKNGELYLWQNVIGRGQAGGALGE